MITNNEPTKPYIWIYRYFQWALWIYYVAYVGLWDMWYRGGIIFGNVFAEVGSTWCPKVVGLTLIIQETEAMELYVHWFGFARNDGFVGHSESCGVLYWIGILGYGQTILMRFWWRGTIYLAHMKRHACSATAAEDMTNLMVYVIVRTGPLMLVMGTFSDNIMCAPAWMRLLLTLI